MVYQPWRIPHLTCSNLFKECYSDPRLFLPMLSSQQQLQRTAIYIHGIVNKKCFYRANLDLQGASWLLWICKQKAMVYQPWRIPHLTCSNLFKECYSDPRLFLPMLSSPQQLQCKAIHIHDIVNKNAFIMQIWSCKLLYTMA